MMKSILLICFAVGFVAVDAFTPMARVYTQQPINKVTRKTINFMVDNSNSATTLEKETMKAKELSSLELETNKESVAKDEEMSETKRMLQQVKDAGLAGVISYAAWEIGFWAVSVPVVLFGYYEFTGHFPDLSDKEDIAKLSAEAFAFVNFARFAVPLRIGLALSTTPWIQTNLVDKFMKK